MRAMVILYIRVDIAVNLDRITFPSTFRLSSFRREHSGSALRATWFFCVARGDIQEPPFSASSI